MPTQASELRQLTTAINQNLRYQRAIRLITELTIRRELTPRQIACYYVFLREYFSIKRGDIFMFPQRGKRYAFGAPRDYAFYSISNLATLLAERNATMGGDFPLSSHTNSLKDDIAALERNNLIVKQDRRIETAKYPQLASLRSEYNKKTWNKTTYQPNIEQLPIDSRQHYPGLWSATDEYIDDCDFIEVINILQWLFAFEDGDYQFNSNDDPHFLLDSYSKQQLAELCISGLSELGITTSQIAALTYQPSSILQTVSTGQPRAAYKRKNHSEVTHEKIKPKKLPR